MQTATVKNHKVFVYGSLMLGFGNNRLLRSADYIGVGVTVDPEFEMISLGGFPGVLKKGESAILGELYSCDDETMLRLDGLESNGSMYLREEVDIFCANDGETHSAWMYFFLHGDRFADFEGVESQQTECGIFVQKWTHVPYRFFNTEATKSERVSRKRRRGRSNLRRPE